MTPALACTDTPGSLRRPDQRGAGVIPSPIRTPSSYILPAAPIAALIASRQRAWGFSDEDMAAFLGQGCRIVDARGYIPRPTAERILRRLATTPARGNARSSATARHAAVAEAWQGVSPTVRQRIAAELAGRTGENLTATKGKGEGMKPLDYLSTVPSPDEIPPGVVVIHNSVRAPSAAEVREAAQRQPSEPEIGIRGFRAWLGSPEGRYVCECGWHPELGTHYRNRPE